MSFQDTLLDGWRATLHAAGAALEVDVLGFEFPDAKDDVNAAWLLARVTWHGVGGELSCDGALFMIEELSAWGHAAIAQDECIDVRFVAPNVRYACVARDGNDERIVRLGLLHEADSGNTHLETRMMVTRAELAAFGRALVEAARALAARRARLRATQRRAGGDGSDGGAAAEVA